MLTNLKDAKELVIGEHFMFGRYANYPIEWIKVSEYSAIAAFILDEMVFERKKNNYKNSRVRVWCNELGEKLGLSIDKIYIPHEHELVEWSIVDDIRECDYSKELKERGAYGYIPNYWIQTAGKNNSNNLRCVFESRLLDEINPKNSYIGVRPALKLDNNDFSLRVWRLL